MRSNVTASEKVGDIKRFSPSIQKIYGQGIASDKEHEHFTDMESNIFSAKRDILRTSDVFQGRSIQEDQSILAVSDKIRLAFD